LQIVDTRREGRRTVPRVLATLGRVDQLAATGAVDGLRRALGRVAAQGRGMAAHRQEALAAGAGRPLGPHLVFGRLWQTVGLQALLTDLLQERRFEFPGERAGDLTVRHRRFESGSDRAAERWRREVCLPGTEGLALHHLDRARRWVGETTDAVEDAWFRHRRDRFTELPLAVFETTSLDFEGQGGESLGPYGPSKDHRPERHQMIVGAVLTGEGRPVCCARWPGHHADGRALRPVVDRLRERFGRRQVCWVADRGMISARTSAGLEARRVPYVLGARRRRRREGRLTGLGRAGRYQEVAENLRGKEGWVEGRRASVCHNPEAAAKEAAAREAILGALADQLRQGAQRWVGHRGCRRFLPSAKGTVTIDQAKVAAEARDDGTFVLRTNTTLPAAAVAVQDKRLLRIEPFCRAATSRLETRPICQQGEATLRGQVCCSFLALVLVDERQRCLAARGWRLEWADIRRALEVLAAVEGREGARGYGRRTALPGVAGTVLPAVGVALPPPVRPLPDVVPRPDPLPVTP
jgi:hypothetical protein